MGGPDVIGVVSAPTSVNRDLNVTASGSGAVNLIGSSLRFNGNSLSPTITFLQAAPTGSTTSTTLVNMPAPLGTTGVGPITTIVGDTLLLSITINVFFTGAVGYVALALAQDAVTYINLGTIQGVGLSTAHTGTFVVAFQPGNATHTYTMQWSSSQAATTVNVNTGIFSNVIAQRFRNVP